MIESTARMVNGKMTTEGGEAFKLTCSVCGATTPAATPEPRHWPEGWAEIQTPTSHCGHLCPECAETHCSRCGREFADDELFEVDGLGLEVEGGGRECGECAGKVKCSCCGKVIDRDSAMTPDAGAYCEDDTGELCESCYYDDEPVVTVTGADGEVHGIGAYRADEEALAVVASVGYKHTDGWRGYYTFTVAEGWERVREDCILSMSRDAEELHEFDEAVRKVFGEKGVEWARVISCTSNCCSAGYDLLARTADLDRNPGLREAVEKLVEAYRDPVRFNITAVTGADPSELSPVEAMVGVLGALMLKGAK